MTVKSIILLVFMIILCTSNAFANEFGSYSPSLDSNQTLDDAQAAVASSQALRQEISASAARTIASFSEEDKKWAREFEELMEDDSELDYLEKIEKELL